MVVIAGCIVRKGNKILMVKEGKKNCYGQWNYPAGHMEEGEKITDTAIRETFEETGCKVKLTGVLPILNDGPAIFSLSCASSFGKGSKASVGRFNFSSAILSSKPRFHLI